MSREDVSLSPSSALPGHSQVYAKENISEESSLRIFKTKLSKLSNCWNTTNVLAKMLLLCVGNHIQLSGCYVGQFSVISIDSNGPPLTATYFSRVSHISSRPISINKTYGEVDSLIPRWFCEPGLVQFIMQSNMLVIDRDKTLFLKCNHIKWIEEEEQYQSF